MIINAYGGTIKEIDGYKVHTFTQDGVFEIVDGNGHLELMLIGGGGAYYAGDMLITTPHTVFGPGRYPLKVGLGGIIGGDSSFMGYTAHGGVQREGYLAGSTGVVIIRYKN